MQHGLKSRGEGQTSPISGRMACGLRLRDGPVERSDAHLLGADAGSAPDPNDRGKVLQLRFTVEDEGVFTVPWTATVTYRRGVEPWREVVCAENVHGFYAGGRVAAPTAEPPDF